MAALGVLATFANPALEEAVASAPKQFELFLRKNYITPFVGLDVGDGSVLYPSNYISFNLRRPSALVELCDKLNAKLVVR